MSEFIATLPNAMVDVGLDLRHILAGGIGGYGLEGPALIEFVRRCLHSLVRAGAMPWRWVDEPGGGHWEIETRYGSDPSTIVEGVIADWRASGVEVPDDLEYWFGTPAMLAARRRHDASRR